MCAMNGRICYGLKVMISIMVTLRNDNTGKHSVINKFVAGDKYMPS